VLSLLPLAIGLLILWVIISNAVDHGTYIAMVRFDYAKQCDLYEKQKAATKTAQPLGKNSKAPPVNVNPKTW
jgi:hypothetical protein